MYEKEKHMSECYNQNNKQKEHIHQLKETWKVTLELQAEGRRPIPRFAVRMIPRIICHADIKDNYA